MWLGFSALPRSGCAAEGPERQPDCGGDADERPDRCVHAPSFEALPSPPVDVRCGCGILLREPSGDTCAANPLADLSPHICFGRPPHARSRRPYGASWPRHLSTVRRTLLEGGAMTRISTVWMLVFGAGIACGSQAQTGFDGGTVPDSASDAVMPRGDGGGEACTPGQQIACACPGGGNGAQVCLPNGGGFGACDGCGGASSSSGGGVSSGSGGGSSGPSDACIPLTMSQACPSNLQPCGQHGDGCGGTYECGTCNSPQECSCGSSSGGFCCTPATCAKPVMGLQGCGTTQDGCGCSITCPACPLGPCVTVGVYAYCDCNRAMSLDAQCAQYSLPANAYDCSSGNSPSSSCKQLNSGEFCCP